jgi:hypothetical protein
MVIDLKDGDRVDSRKDGQTASPQAAKARQFRPPVNQ